jgi:hypothetical protein
MMAAKRRASGGAQPSGDAQMVVRLFRTVTEEQFDVWLACLNRAANAMGSDAPAFTRDDRQKTISYWYLLMLLLEVYAGSRNPFEVRKGETWWSEGLLPMKELSRELSDRYKEETVRRYLFDLKRRGLIALDGRGPAAPVQLSAPAILALADTIRQWVAAFRDVDRRLQKTGALASVAD